MTATAISWSSDGIPVRNSTDVRTAAPDLHANLFRSTIPQHLDNEMAGGTADNGVINHDDAFSGYCFALTTFSLTFTAEHGCFLFRLDEGSRPT